MGVGWEWGWGGVGLGGRKGTVGNTFRKLGVNCQGKGPRGKSNVGAIMFVTWILKECSVGRCGLDWAGPG